MTAIEREVTDMYAKQMPQYDIRAEKVDVFPTKTHRTIQMREFITYNNLKFVIWGSPKQSQIKA
jgi:hypothetical protein